MGASDVDQRGARGAQAEQLVAVHYTDLGYTVLDRNWSCQGGELDLVVAQGETVVFVEVRSVSTDFLPGAELSVTLRKQTRVALAAELWLAENGEAYADIRFDVVAVRFRLLRRAQLERFEDAFIPPWAV